MASEMVERVARAIWALNEDTDCSDYDQLAPHAKERANKWARAAIEAMREPTGAMYEITDSRNGYVTNAAWDAVIDAALREPTP